MLHYIKGTEKMIHDLNVCSTLHLLTFPSPAHNTMFIMCHEKKETDYIRVAWCHMTLGLKSTVTHLHHSKPRAFFNWKWFFGHYKVHITLLFAMIWRVRKNAQQDEKRHENCAIFSGPSFPDFSRAILLIEISSSLWEFLDKPLGKSLTFKGNSDLRHHQR